MQQRSVFTKKAQNISTVMMILVSTNDQLVTGIEQVLREHEQFVFVHANENIFTLRKNSRMGILSSVILLDFDGRENETSSLLAEFRKHAPHSPVIAMSTRPTQDHIQKSFMFGVEGYLTGKDRIQKLVPMLQGFLRSGYPPLSKEVVPHLMNIVRGRTDSDIDLTTLSELQKNVARALASGMSYQEIADSMQINLDNLRYHIKQVYKKLNITKRIHLVSMVQ